MMRAEFTACRKSPDRLLILADCVLSLIPTPGNIGDQNVHAVCSVQNQYNGGTAATGLISRRHVYK